MSLSDSFHNDRSEHPLDIVERMASLRDWSFDRAGDDEIAITIGGRWTSYDVAFTWLEDIEALHVACAFDLKIPDRKRAEITDLMSRINEQLWIGHFDMWSETDVVMFRHSLCLAGGASASDAQCSAVVKAAVSACETYFQAFQFVLWADRSPAEAVAFAAFETRGAA